ncbi:MAG: hypothetical protein GX298_11650 [Planctomycetes bacterium]|jgi:hypothetical protein|nr:hypothetical protein [Planctomycetota bacterium]
MRRKIVTGLVLISVGATSFLLCGCETDAQNAALLGTAIGAGAGQLIGGDTEATLIGAGVGAGAGYIIGNEKDKARQRDRAAAAPTDPTTETVWITNSNGSQISVRLIKDGPAYIGPRGERYPTRPTEEQLRQVYGF